jgi:hypothetical protein
MAWHAYPILIPSGADHFFILHEPSMLSSPSLLLPGLYYVNAMESVVSTMETQMIAAENVVQLMIARKKNKKPVEGSFKAEL